MKSASKFSFTLSVMVFPVVLVDGAVSVRRGCAGRFEQALFVIGNNKLWKFRYSFHMPEICCYRGNMTDLIP